MGDRSFFLFSILGSACFFNIFSFSVTCTCCLQIPLCHFTRKLIKQVSDCTSESCRTPSYFSLMGICGWFLWFRQQEADATLRKARALKAQRREEYQKAHSSTNRSQEEQSNVANKQLEKKRRLEEEALQKVGRGADDRRENSSYITSGPLQLGISSTQFSVFLALVRRRKLRTSTRAVWLTQTSGRWIWPTLSAPSSLRSGRWSSSVTSRSKLWVVSAWY